MSGLHLLAVAEELVLLLAGLHGGAAELEEGPYVSWRTREATFLRNKAEQATSGAVRRNAFAFLLVFAGLGAAYLGDQHAVALLDAHG